MAAPRWSKFLAETFCGDFELIDYVQELIGASAVGEVFLHIVPFFYGKSGDNGKTVLVEVLRAVMGDYAQQAPANFLMAGRDKHPTEIARLKGARIVFCPELNEGDIFDEAKLKTLASGDTLTGRYMHRDFFDFEPTHSLVMMGNHKPAVKAGGNSFWRRVRVIPFNYKVPEDKQIKGLAKQLVDEEGPAILAWIVAGAAQVLSHGLVLMRRFTSAAPAVCIRRHVPLE